MRPLRRGISTKLKETNKQTKKKKKRPGRPKVILLTASYV